MNRGTPIPWLGDDPSPSPAAAPEAPAPAETAARRLLREHLSRGSVARREPAAFALALTLPEAAAAVRAFLARRQPR